MNLNEGGRGGADANWKKRWFKTGAIVALGLVTLFVVVEYNANRRRQAAITVRPAPPPEQAESFGADLQTRRGAPSLSGAEEDSPNEGLPKLTPRQVEDFVERNKRTADSLLSAFLATGDAKYLREAAETHSSDPKVQFRVIMEDLYPADRRQWLERLKQSAPDNTLARYLSAVEYLKQNQPGQAMDDLNAALGKGGYDDYARECMQCLEEILLAAGMTPRLAKIGSFQAINLRHLTSLKHLTGELIGLRGEYGAAGDSAPSEVVMETINQLAHELSSGRGGALVINQLVGIAIEQRFLAQLDANAIYPESGMSVRDRIAELNRLRQEIKEASLIAREVVASPDDSEVASYIDRVKIHGEYQAMKWYQQKNRDR